MTRFKGLPHWCMTGTRPAFYDTESATAIEMVAKLYGSYSELVEDYNKYVDEINKAIMDFETGVISDTTTFKETITKIVHDYIKMIDDKVKIQDATIEEAVNYMKNNIIYAITETVNEMKTSGELAEIVVEGFNDAIARITTLETTLTSIDAKAEKNIDDILDLTNRVRTAENTVSTMESKVNQSTYTVDSLSKEVGSVKTDMTTLSNEVAGVKTANTNTNRNLTTLTGRVEENENNINHLDGLVSSHENNITELESRVGTLEITGGTGGTGVSNVYSEQETIIGTWLGKPLYRKVIYVPSIDCTNEGFKTVVHNVNNIKKVINFNFTLDAKDLTNDYTNMVYNTVITSIGFNNQNIRLYVNKWAVITDWYFIMEYTKTTD